MIKKAYLVFTTINIPKIANDFYENFEKFGHKKKVGIIIIGDKKTPDEPSFKICKELQRKGFEVEYFDIAVQEKWLDKYPKLKEIIPYNSDNRRNIGFLLALERGCDFLISVDDDNFPLENEDFFSFHNIVSENCRLPVIKTNSKWFNICDLLEKDPNQRIYPRGFPYNKRWQEKEVMRDYREVRIALNEGLWLGDPDVDSITRINQEIKISQFKGSQIALDIGVWSPINTQNTSLSVEILPAFYFILMGEKVDDLVVDRYGDIWAGFFTKKVIDTLGYHVSFGHPICNHLRNTHNLFKDLKQELGCIIYTDLLLEWLENVNLKGRDAIELYADLSDKFLEYVSKDKRFSADFVKYTKKLNYNQKVWLETVQKIK